MKHVSILIPLGQASLVNIEGSRQILTQVNTFMQTLGKMPEFTIQLVGLSKEVRQSSGLFTISPEVVIGEVAHTDLILIPAMHGDQAQALMINQGFVSWIRRQHSAGAEIASMCIGAFFLASTGLLDGRQCATHWVEASNFRRMFPKVNLVDDKILTDEDGIYTSGGAYAYLNLLLYLIEKYVGRDMAILIAKTFMIDMDRHSQSPFIMFQVQRDHPDETIKKAQEYIETHFHERITVDQLAYILALSRRNFERRFKKATGNTIAEYMQRVKIEAAKKNLESGKRSVNEVMYEVGYNDTKTFRETFKKITGLSPVEYRNKYNRELVEMA
ncbi:MAG: helix-turn-helix domain-containing protein [Bacteroidetes bacterium]|nr:helix-turn-helix domain-containing protein [Bacteroidota bacterium]